MFEFLGDFIMNRMKCITLVAFALGTAVSFAAKDSNWNIQNSLRVGYDDNIYQSRDSNRQETGFISDIITISGDLNFSDRSALELFWQPEFRYRFDADPKAIMYQDLYARFTHSLTERLFVDLSNRFKYQDKGGQSDFVGQTQDQNYFDNDLRGALDYSLNPASRVNVGGGYKVRVWEDDFYGETRGNNFDQYTANASYNRALKKETTFGLAGVNYVNQVFDGTRGGYDSTTIYGGVDHNFNPTVVGTTRLGYSMSTIDAGGADQDASSPYLQAGLDYSASERTTFTGSLGYSIAASQNSIYNAGDAFDVGLGATHDLTGKISLSSTLRYVFTMYDSLYSRFGVGDAQEDFFRFSIRGSYQINRNNFVDLGYEFTMRDADSPFIQEYTRNRMDLGWRLRF